MSGQTSSASRSTILALGIGLLLSLGVAIPAAQAQLNVQIEIEEAIFVQGAILVTGTVTCSEPTGFTNVGVEVRQPIGSKKSQRGFTFDSPGPCPGPEGLPFEILVAPDAGRFKAGTVFVFASADACTPDFSSCDNDADAEVIDVSK
jgi:hypothetical protein